MLKKRIVIVDRDEDFIAGAAALIRNSDKFLLVKIYDDAREALKRLIDDLPDIVMMDLDFPELSGFEFVIKARAKVPKLDVLVVTNHDEGEDVLSAIANGAIGYLLKRRCITNLLDALTAIANGGAALDPHIARFIINSLQVNHGSPLSMRETSVLKLLVQGKSCNAIGKDLLISGKTARTHVRNIYRKLKVNSKAEAIRKAVSEKLVMSHLDFHVNHNLPTYSTFL